MVSRRLLLAGTAALLISCLSPSMQYSEASPQAVRPPQTSTTSTEASETELTVRIGAASPSITPGEPLTLRGMAINADDFAWTDAKLYLSVASDPATSEKDLKSFAATEGTFGTRIVKFGLFDQIGTLSPGERRPWKLSIPFRQLPITGGPGAYAVQVSLLAGTRAGRDEEADAQVNTLVPLLPEQSDGPSSVLTVIPMTAAVMRHPDGTFAADNLRSEFASGGRLRNLLDLVGAAPSDTLQLAVDPALWQAAKDMAAGYHVGPYVRPVIPDGGAADPDRVKPSINGQGQQAAARWLADLEEASTRQPMGLLPWGNPDTNALSDAAMPGVVQAAITASRGFASDNGLNAPIVDWQNNGSTTRHALDVARSGGAALHVLSELSLPRLDSYTRRGSPPSQVLLSSRRGPLAAVVTRFDLAGVPFTHDLSAFDFRQLLLASATVAALDRGRPRILVTAAPFNWDPGPRAGRVDLTPAFASPVLAAADFTEVEDQLATSYIGPVQDFRPDPELSAEVLERIARLRSTGRTYTQLLSENEQASKTFARQLAEAGSATWRWHPRRGEAYARRATSAMARQVARVTVSGPAFVAMSSSTGRFPLTVSNELDVPVTVRLEVRARNPALEISEVPPFQLAAGQRRDVEVRTHAEGSGVTPVEAKLSTVTSRRFGQSWQFDVRATQIGLAIWLVIGAAGTVLVIAAGRRLVQRFRASGFRPRGEQPS